MRPYTLNIRGRQLLIYEAFSYLQRQHFAREHLCHSGLAELAASVFVLLYQLLRQYLYFCTSKASKIRVNLDARKPRRHHLSPTRAQRSRKQRRPDCNRRHFAPQQLARHRASARHAPPPTAAARDSSSSSAKSTYFKRLVDAA